jgi:hypothetical protein
MMLSRVMKTQVEFWSDKFPACESEEEEINPKRWWIHEEFNNPRI